VTSVALPITRSAQNTSEVGAVDSECDDVLLGERPAGRAVAHPEDDAPAEVSVVDGHDDGERTNRERDAAEVRARQQILTLGLGENLSVVMEEHAAMIVVRAVARH